METVSKYFSNKGNRVAAVYTYNSEEHPNHPYLVVFEDADFRKEYPFTNLDDAEDFAEDWALKGEENGNQISGDSKGQ